MIQAELGHTLESFVAHLVASGRFDSPSEVLREGVRLIQAREAGSYDVDAALRRGLADADSGRTRSADTIFDRLDAKYRATRPES